MNSTLRGRTSFELGNDAGGVLSQQGCFKRGHLLVVMPVILEQFKWGLGLGSGHFFTLAGYYFIENIHGLWFCNGSVVVAWSALSFGCPGVFLPWLWPGQRAAIPVPCPGPRRC